LALPIIKKTNPDTDNFPPRFQLANRRAANNETWNEDGVLHGFLGGRGDPTGRQEGQGTKEVVVIPYEPERRIEASGAWRRGQGFFPACTVMNVQN